MIPWLSGHYLEILGVVFSLLYLYFSIRQRILLWPMEMISALLYMVVFYRTKFYADMGLNGYYLLISIYGWYHWSREKGSMADGPPVTRLEPRLGILLGLITVAGFFAIGWTLDSFTDSPLPYWDAFTTAASFTATWMLARKILEHWIVWIIVDAVSMGLYLYRGLFPTMFLFVVYTVMAITGFIQWKRSLQQPAH